MEATGANEVLVREEHPGFTVGDGCLHVTPRLFAKLRLMVRTFDANPHHNEQYGVAWPRGCPWVALDATTKSLYWIGLSSRDLLKLIRDAVRSGRCAVVVTSDGKPPASAPPSVPEHVP